MLNIKNVKGDVIVSNNQSGGFTGKTIQDSSKTEKSKIIKNIVKVVFFVAALVAILSYFNINPNKKMNEDQVNINGDMVVSNNQTGGITAHTVNITGLQKRVIGNKKSEIVGILKKESPAAYRLYYSPNDPEVNNLANEINSILLEAGWKEINPIKVLGGPTLPPGITIFMLKPEIPITTLNNELWSVLGNSGVEGQVLTDVKNVFTVRGWPPVELPNGMSGTVIFIGPNPAN